MSTRKSKRRSFWEPESTEVVKWLNNQKDLGTSLQLIIVDAIHQYGQGDVIKAHLNRREQSNAHFMLQGIRTDASMQTEKSGENQQEDNLDTPTIEESSSIEQKEIPAEKPPVDSTVTQEVPPAEKSKEPEEYDPITIMMQDSGSTFHQ